MANISCTLKTGSYHVFGSGSSWAVLTADDIVRVKGSDMKSADNGFIGYEWSVVTLPEDTEVEYEVGAYPGGGFKFKGYWGELVESIEQRYRPDSNWVKDRMSLYGV